MTARGGLSGIHLHLYNRGGFSLVDLWIASFSSGFSGFGHAKAGNRGVLEFGPQGGWDSQPSLGSCPVSTHISMINRTTLGELL